MSMAFGNPYGVLDHHVALLNGTTGRNTFRVAQAGPHGCVFSFVMPRQPGGAMRRRRTPMRRRSNVICRH